MPVNVDAVLFWMVHDSEKAALEVQDYTQAVSWAAQTELHRVTSHRSHVVEGRTLLLGHEADLGSKQALIDQRSNPWE